MSSDKDSVAPERLWINPVHLVSELHMENAQLRLEKCFNNDIPYIRDDGDLISRSTVVKRLTDLSDEHSKLAERNLRDGYEDEAEIESILGQFANRLADEFEAADKPNPAREAKLREIDDRRADGYEAVFKASGSTETILVMLEDINYLRTFVPAPPADKDLELK